MTTSDEGTINRCDFTGRLQAEQIFEEQFWPLYPPRDNNRKKPAKEKSVSLVVKYRVPSSEIVDGVKRYAAAREGQDPQFTMMAMTFLNQEAWKSDFTLGQKLYKRRPMPIGEVARELFELARDSANGKRDYDEG